VDWLFGTLHLPKEWPRSYGCDGEVPDRGYVDRLISPWRSTIQLSSTRAAAGFEAETDVAHQ
jgi:hypothetical protein